ncbi:MAG: Asp-tRNA(Asn)/Glu-tRNA(Gln) amidotransferase subunit GatB [Rhodothermales bacterium]|nr:Asp-tRNA(Asn)/Glu-tRNA(Gln) amidotransferase subunit GatB [Rhodothermales bacterium]
MTQAEYELVVGLEVHCQLKTRSKMFSPVSAEFCEDPNVHVDPVVLGHPGSLPVPNEKAIEYVARLGLATGCSIRPVSHFARKHYFYPDLPKGYQISQFEDPICYEGRIEIPASKDEPEFVVRITRIHLEEDAGKSIHDGSDTSTLLDYNRAGVPLAELVTEPDIRTPHQAFVFLKYMRQLVRYLGVSDGNMQEGSLRCDANISIRPKGSTALGVKTEIKNMNSFRHVEAALGYEFERQIDALRNGTEIIQETLLWDVDRQITRSMRSKEDSHDYRYFRDPDLPPLVLNPEWLERIKVSLPELPTTKATRFVEQLGLSDYDADVLTEERETAEYFERVLAALDRDNSLDQVSTKNAANLVMSDVRRIANEHSLEIESFPIDPEQLAGLVVLRVASEVSSSAAQRIIEIMLDSNMSAHEIAVQQNLLSVTSEDLLIPLVRQVIDDNPKQVEQYLSGKETLIGYFIGNVMRMFDGSPDPQVVRGLLQEELERRATN